MILAIILFSFVLYIIAKVKDKKTKFYTPVIKSYLLI